MSLRAIVNRQDTSGGRVFALTIQCLILLSIICIAIETLPDLEPATRRLLRQFEIFTVSVFTVEYVLRIYAADNKLKFIFSFFGLIDLLAILPFYLSAGIDLRFIRGFRLLRLFRIFKLVRYSRAARRYHRAFIMSREELALFGLTSLIILFLASIGIYYFENPVQPEVFSSVFHSLWWAIITLTTVGYGDMVPVTIGGRFFTFVLLILGLGVVAVPTAIISGALARAREEEDQ